MNKKNLIGERIRVARRMAKPSITQLDLIARLQVLGIMIDQSSLSKLENGQRPVTDTEVVALSKALNLPVAWFFEDLEKPED